MYTSPLEFFVYYAWPAILLVIGLTGNPTGMNVLKNKKLKKLVPLFMYRLMFVVDTAFLLVICVPVLDKGFQISLYLISTLSCKLIYQFAFAFKLYSPLILVYIALDRFVSIKFYAKRPLLKKSKFQYMFVSFFFVATP